MTEVVAGVSVGRERHGHNAPEVTAREPQTRDDLTRATVDLGRRLAVDRFELGAPADHVQTQDNEFVVGAGGQL